jgi:predicted phage terminase large subunit-like protein
MSPQRTLIVAVGERPHFSSVYNIAVEGNNNYFANGILVHNCDHLEAVSAGDIKRLLINIPPRHAKSTIVSVLWPTWEWLVHPQEKYLCASYSSVLSIRDNLKARRIIQSPWFQARWGHLFVLTGDQNAKQRFENDKTGYRIATSVGGATTGDGGSRLLLDDPHGAQDAQSDALRATALEWFDMVWSTRLNNPATDAMVVIMQRLHEADISGHILRDLKGWEHLCLPAEWDGVKRVTSLGPYDPRSAQGDLLWPSRFTKKVLEGLKESLGEYGTAGQLQQAPNPAGGGILRIEHFQKWPKDTPIPSFEYVVQSYDCAFSEKTTGDPTACIVWGLFKYKGKMNAMLVDSWAEHLGYPALRQRAIDDWHATYGGDAKRNPLMKARKPDKVIIEAKASGLSLIQDLRLANVPVFPYNPGNADKVSRAHQSAPVLESDALWIPESRKNPGQYVVWAQPFLQQLERFPVAEHDDFVDCFSQSIIWLRDAGWFDMPYAEDDPIEEIDYAAKRKVNPYNA